MDCQATCPAVDGMDPVLIGLTNLAMLIPGVLLGLIIFHLVRRAYDWWVKRTSETTTKR